MVFLTVYLAMSVRIDLFPSKGSFCDLTWGLLAMRISAFLVFIDIYWACLSELGNPHVHTINNQYFSY